MAHDVFISYASRDKLIADAICSALEDENIRSWFAPRDIPLGEHNNKRMSGGRGVSETIFHKLRPLFIANLKRDKKI